MFWGIVFNRMSHVEELCKCAKKIVLSTKMVYIHNESTPFFSFFLFCTGPFQLVDVTVLFIVLDCWRQREPSGIENISFPG